MLERDRAGEGADQGDCYKGSATESCPKERFNHLWKLHILLCIDSLQGQTCVSMGDSAFDRYCTHRAASSLVFAVPCWDLTTELL